MGSAIERRRAWVEGEPSGKKKKKEKRRRRGSMMTDEAWVAGEPGEREMEIACEKERGYVWRLKYNIWVWHSATVHC